MQHYDINLSHKKSSKEYFTTMCHNIVDKEEIISALPIIIDLVESTKYK